jgi:hypothetical protein
MKLNIHYKPENKTWTQGLCHRIDISDGGSCFGTDRKALLYGIRPSFAPALIDLLEKSEHKEITLTVTPGVGGYIWGVIGAEVVGEDPNLCKMNLDRNFQSSVLTRSPNISEKEHAALVGILENGLTNAFFEAFGDTD